MSQIISLGFGPNGTSQGFFTFGLSGTPPVAVVIGSGCLTQGASFTAGFKSGQAIAHSLGFQAAGSYEEGFQAGQKAC